jgi:hypothetical protein
MSIERARKHLDLASEQWDRACTDAWEPSDAASCVTNVFYAYENLIVAAAEAHNVRWAKNHYKKADLASKLFKRKALKVDLGDELLRLNDLRKDVSYGEPGYELAGEDLEELVTKLEELLDEVRSIVTEIEEAAVNE